MFFWGIRISEGRRRRRRRAHVLSNCSRWGYTFLSALYLADAFLNCSRLGGRISDFRSCWARALFERRARRHADAIRVGLRQLGAALKQRAAIWAELADRVLSSPKRLLDVAGVRPPEGAAPRAGATGPRATAARAAAARAAAAAAGSDSDEDGAVVRSPLARGGEQAQVRPARAVSDMHMTACGYAYDRSRICMLDSIRICIWQHTGMQATRARTRCSHARGWGARCGAHSTYAYPDFHWLLC